MCQSYMATKDETCTTRARANLLREFLTHSPKDNPFDHKELYDILDLCLSCKGCKAECPSNIDMAKFKAEFLQHWYEANGIPFRTWLIAHNTQLNRIASMFPGISAFFFRNSFFSGIIKKSVGFAKKRRLPVPSKITLIKWFRKYRQTIAHSTLKKGKVFFFADEFTNYTDAEIGIKAIKLLLALGYQVEIPEITESGRTFISKGLLRKAKKIANENIRKLAEQVNEQTPLIGIEPSSILTFRDEYPVLADKNLLVAAKKLADCSFLFEEFISAEIEKGKIVKECFRETKRKILFHGHCHQKSLSSTLPLKKILAFAGNNVEEIPSGCC